MKNSNIIHSTISVKIFDGLKLVAGSDSFTSVEEARNSAARIIKNQKEICGDEMCAYAMVFQGNKMLYYID